MWPGSGFITILLYQLFSSEITTENAFLLLDGENLNLLDNTFMLLLGS